MQSLIHLVLVAALTAAASSLAWADLDSAREAARRGDHATAYRELLPLAELGNVDAQYYLGGLYYKGEGVGQNYAKAVEWFSKSADQGNPKAQTDLAQCYLFGYGVERDSKNRCHVVSACCYARLCARCTQPRCTDIWWYRYRKESRTGPHVGNNSDVQVRWRGL